MLQIITVTLDLEKITEFGSIIMRVVPPRPDLPKGTVLIHNPLSLPGFKMQVTEDAPTMTIFSEVSNAKMAPMSPMSPVSSAPATPVSENVVKGVFGKGKNNKKV